MIGSTLIAVVGTPIYYGITKFNSINEVIDNYDPSKIQALEIQLKAQQERLLSIQDSNIKINEKASDAIATARETAALAKGSQREVEASLTSVRSEVKAQLEGLNDRMKALQKATTNPIGN
jgi:hypothetical protein